MTQIQYVEEDFVVVRRKPNSAAKRSVTLTFGDPVRKLHTENGWTQVEVLSYYGGPFTGFVKGDLPVRDQPILSFSMIDVQQGDGLILQTPRGKTVFIDGGDNVLFARHAELVSATNGQATTNRWKLTPLSSPTAMPTTLTA